LDADLAGNPFSPSAPPEGPSGAAAPPGRPTSAQGLRKSRTNTRSNTDRFRGDQSPSPALSVSNSTSSLPDQKSANESYFATLGQANASRSGDLPPSQGGRYQGFGSTPSPDPIHPLSSRAAPSLSELQENPMAALSKGWSLFSAAVSGATRAVSENVIQPGMERAMDPTLQASLRGYVSEASKRAGDLGKSANDWSKNQFGVDVADQVGGVVGTVREKIGGGPASNGYGTVPYDHDGENSTLYDYEDEDDFFREHTGGQSSQRTQSTSATPASSGPGKKDEWDEWKDF
jgi:ADP-ribosylation factor GTPase-activating protein 1